MASFNLTIVALALEAPPPLEDPPEVVDGCGSFFFPNQFIVLIRSVFC